MTARGKASIFWNEERIERLLRLDAQGMSATQMARVMGCTRNSIIGKIHRIKGTLTSATMPHEVRQATAPKPKTAPKPLYIDADSARDIAPDPVEPPSLRVSITDIRDHMCKWPSGDPRDMSTFSFCGHPTTETYCPYHKRKASGGKV